MKRLVATAVVAVGAWFAAAGGLSEAQAQWATQSMPPPMSTFGGRLMVSSEAGGSQALPIVDEQINVDIDGQHASTRLRQTFHNQSRVQVEGLYSLRAGPGVKADGFAYWNGEQKIVGEVFERQTARQVYQNVTRQRRDPGLLEETGDGVFSFAVAPIEPNERKRVEVSYGQWLPRHATSIEFHAPVTRPDSEVVVNIWDWRELREIHSPTHKIDVQRLSNGRTLVRARKALGTTSEMLLRYQVSEKPWTVSGYVHRDKEQDAYFMLALAAPDLPASATVAKDVTLVIDRSGSMAGEMIRQARASCIDIVRRLRSDDRVNVIQFDHRVEKLYPEPKPVTEANRKQAIEYLELMEDGGGTNLAYALEQAMAAQAVGGDRPRVIMFFTDGRSDVPSVFEAAKADKRDVRVFTVGFGPEVNRPLLARLAAGKRGRFTYISAASNIEREVGTLYRQIDAPVLVDVSLETTGGAVTRLYPPTLSDLFVDDELRISGRLRASGPVTFTLKGKQGGRAVAYRVKLEGTAEVKRPWVARQWAGARVEDLVDEIALGGHRSELQGEVIDLALAYNLASPYTAFLAIPASELDAASAHQLESARRYKADIMRRRPDAARVAGLGGGESSGGETARDMSLGSPPSSGSLSRRRSRSPGGSEEMSAHRSAPVYDMEDAAEAPASASGEQALAQNDAPRPKMRVGRKDSSLAGLDRRGGCASCALGGDGGGGALAGLAVAGMLLAAFARRRRRRR